MYYYAVVKAVELVGESASRVSGISRSEYPEIDWDQIVSMRHHLVHNFYGLDNDKLWEAIHGDMPVLIGQLQEALAQQES